MWFPHFPHSAQAEAERSFIHNCATTVGPCAFDSIERGRPYSSLSWPFERMDCGRWRTLAPSCGREHTELKVETGNGCLCVYSYKT